MGMFQLHIFDSGLTPLKNKEVKFVSYKKAYFVYAYDREKYMDIFKKLGELAKKYKNPAIVNNINPYKIARHCYIKEGSFIKSLGDEKHIYRLKTLHKIHEKIYEKMPLFLDKDITYQIGNIICYPCERQAEIKDTWDLPIKERIKLHIALLRKLRMQKKSH